MKTKISGAVLISILTVVSYLISYSYQVGYYNHFNIPAFMIEINLVSTLVSISIVITFLFALYYVYHVFINIRTEDTHIRVAQLINKYALLAVYLLIIAISIENSKKIFSYAILPIVSFMLLKDFVFPFFTQKKEISYEKK